MSVPAGWHTDPLGRFQLRYWDGERWTEHVSTNGVPSVSPLDAPPPPGGAMVPAVVAGTSLDPNVVTSEDKTWAVLGHIFGWLIAVIALLVRGNERPFVRDQAIEALNFDITVFLAAIACIPLIFLIIGIPLLLVIIIGSFVLHIVAAVAAGRGERYRYPFCLRLIK
jgi:uncharacterized Tic20 family protein